MPKVAIVSTEQGTKYVKWLPYRGFSALFTNLDPDIHLSSMTDGRRTMGLVDCQVSPITDCRDSLALYSALSLSLRDIGLDSLEDSRNSFGNSQLAALPTNSYHVTVLDCLNDGNKTRVSTAQRACLDAFLDQLPGSIRDFYPFTDMVNQSSLVTQFQRIEFRFRRLRTFEGAVLVAELESVVPEQLEALRTYRRQLTQDFNEAFGEDLNRHPLTVHLTLGYFLPKAPKAALPISSWNETFKERTKGLVVEFTDIDVYGFVDMVTFFRTSALPLVEG